MSDEHDEREALRVVRAIFEEKIPFNRLLGLTVESLDLERPSVAFAMREDLVGNFYKGSLHGGVISAALDVTGGLVAFLGLLRVLRGIPLEERIQRFSRISTIDLRVDFLQPGVGKQFLGAGYILRMGRRVAVTRMELHDDEKRLIAVGTGAYLVG